MKKFGIVGDPVMHSRSPAIHSAGFQAIGLDAEYVFLPTTTAQFPAVIEALSGGELDGVNVTMPHKAMAYESVDRRSDLAERTGAVNTITTVEGDLVGHNTDVAGVLHAVARLGVSSGAPILLLGTGGAARAAAVALEGRELLVVGRQQSKASDLLEGTRVPGRSLTWGSVIPGSIVVNATPLGMHGEGLPEGLLEQAVGFVDMVYGSDQSPAINLAIELGIPFSDGLDMLVGQAVAAFELFTDESVGIEVFESAVRT